MPYEANILIIHVVKSRGRKTYETMGVRIFQSVIIVDRNEAVRNKDEIN